MGTSKGFKTPMMRLQHPDFTKVILVTPAEQMPNEEARLATRLAIVPGQAVEPTGPVALLNVAASTPIPVWHEPRRARQRGRPVTRSMSRAPVLPTPLSRGQTSEPSRGSPIDLGPM